MAQFQESEERLDESIARQDECTEPQREVPEYFEADDAGAAHTDGDVDTYPSFDSERPPLPRLRDLPARARPRILFWLDADFNVHPLVRRAGGSYFEKSEAVVRAIALHLQQHRPLRLQYDGDWVGLPVIERLEASGVDRRPEEAGSQSSLEALLAQVLSSREKAADVIYWVRKRTGMLRSFAFHLPNGDVVTPQALLSPALHNGTRVGAAAVRRLISNWHPSGHMQGLFSPGSAEPEAFTLAGERITLSDWNKLLKTFNKAAQQQKRRNTRNK